MASSSSVSVPKLMKDEESSNWAELPQELLSSILLRLGMVEILASAQKVCTSWRQVCKDPSMWRKINMCGICYLNFHGMCRHVVDLSQGGLLEINISEFGSNDLLSYIADRSNNLRSLTLEMDLSTTNTGLVKAITKLPLLETLEIPRSRFKLDLKAIGQSCTQLQTLKLGYMYAGMLYDDDDDDYALAIAENMPQLRHLQIIGNRLTDIGLNAILDNLPHLKHLDLRMCFNIQLVGDLEKRCLETIRELRRPDESIADCPYNFFLSSSETDDDSDDIYDDYIDHDDYIYDDYMLD